MTKGREDAKPQRHAGRDITPAVHIAGSPAVVTITPEGTGIVIDVRVVPRSGRSGVAGTRDGALLVRLNAPPVEGAANAELIEVVARTLRVPKRAVSIVSGEHSKRKRVRVEGVSEREASSALTPAGSSHAS